MRFDLRPGLDFDDTTASAVAEQRGRIGETRRPGRTGPGRVDTIEELFVGDFRGRGNQGTDVHLARAAEDDAILIDDVDRAVSLDAAQDPARSGVVEYAVERNPIPVSLLVEAQVGPLTHVEG